jgi:hypothetical protein
MWKRFGPTAVLALALPGSGPAAAQAPPTDPPSVVLLEHRLTTPGYAENGVSLRAEAERLTDGGRDRIAVRWRIAYAGRRRPLIILAPSLTRPADTSTEVRVYATGKSGKTYAMRLLNERKPSQDGPRESPTREWFATATAGGEAAGVLEVDTATVRGYLARHLPQEFDAATTPRLHLTLLHAPNERGEALELDAWTGSVSSGTIPVHSME